MAEIIDTLIPVNRCMKHETTRSLKSTVPTTHLLLGIWYMYRRIGIDTHSHTSLYLAIISGL